LIEAVERLIERQKIEQPLILLLVGVLGLTINVVGLFIFGHSHSHDLPSIDDEDEEDNEIDDKCEEIIDLNSNTIENSATRIEQSETKITIRQPDLKQQYKPVNTDVDGGKLKKNKKKAKCCHILCNFFSFNNQ
jgi:Co/Zn/Cd efflux system component